MLSSIELQDPRNASCTTLFVCLLMHLSMLYLFMPVEKRRTTTKNYSTKREKHTAQEPLCRELRLPLPG